jgi:hypothetical protein
MTKSRKKKGQVGKCLERIEKVFKRVEVLLRLPRKSTALVSLMVLLPAGYVGRPGEKCPPNTAICDLGENATIISPTSLGFDHGIVSSGTGAHYYNPVSISQRLEDYASSAERAQEFMSIMHAQTDASWQALPDLQREDKQKRRAEIEAEITQHLHEGRTVLNALLLKLAVNR